MKGGGECAPSASKWNHSQFHFSFLFRGEPTKFHGSQYLLETFEVLRGYVLKRHSYCSAATTY